MIGSYIPSQRVGADMVKDISKIFRLQCSSKLNNSGFSLENREYCRGDPFLWPLYTLYPPTSGGRSVGRVRSRTKATELVLFLF
jgi:hypothetical protein